MDLIEQIRSEVNSVSIGDIIEVIGGIFGPRQVSSDFYNNNQRGGDYPNRVNNNLWHERYLSRREREENDVFLPNFEEYPSPCNRRNSYHPRGRNYRIYKTSRYNRSKQYNIVNNNVITEPLTNKETENMDKSSEKLSTDLNDKTNPSIKESSNEIVGSTKAAAEVNQNSSKPENEIVKEVSSIITQSKVENSTVKSTPRVKNKPKSDKYFDFNNYLLSTRNPDNYLKKIPLKPKLSLQTSSTTEKDSPSNKSETPTGQTAKKITCRRSSTVTPSNEKNSPSYKSPIHQTPKKLSYRRSTIACSSEKDSSMYKLETTNQSAKKLSLRKTATTTCSTEKDSPSDISETPIQQTKKVPLEKQKTNVSLQPAVHLNKGLHLLGDLLNKSSNLNRFTRSNKCSEADKSIPASKKIKTNNESNVKPPEKIETETSKKTLDVKPKSSKQQIKSKTPRKDSKEKGSKRHKHSKDKSKKEDSPKLIFKTKVKLLDANDLFGDISDLEQDETLKKSKNCPSDTKSKHEKTSSAKKSKVEEKKVDKPKSDKNDNIKKINIEEVSNKKRKLIDINNFTDYEESSSDDIPLKLLATNKMKDHEMKAIEVLMKVLSGGDEDTEKVPTPIKNNEISNKIGDVVPITKIANTTEISNDVMNNIGSKARNPVEILENIEISKILVNNIVSTSTEKNNEISIPNNEISNSVGNNAVSVETNTNETLEHTGNKNNKKELLENNIEVDSTPSFRTPIATAVNAAVIDVVDQFGQRDLVKITQDSSNNAIVIAAKDNLALSFTEEDNVKTEPTEDTILKTVKKEESVIKFEKKAQSNEIITIGEFDLDSNEFAKKFSLNIQMLHFSITDFEQKKQMGLEKHCENLILNVVKEFENKLEMYTLEKFNLNTAIIKLLEILPLSMYDILKVIDCIIEKHTSRSKKVKEFINACNTFKEVITIYSSNNYTAYQNAESNKDIPPENVQSRLMDTETTQLVAIKQPIILNNQSPQNMIQTPMQNENFERMIPWQNVFTQNPILLQQPQPELVNKINPNARMSLSQHYMEAGTNLGAPSGTNTVPQFPFKTSSATGQPPFPQFNQAKAGGFNQTHLSNFCEPNPLITRPTNVGKFVNQRNQAAIAKANSGRFRRYNQNQVRFGSPNQGLNVQNYGEYGQLNQSGFAQQNQVRCAQQTQGFNQRNRSVLNEQNQVFNQGSPRQGAFRPSPLINFGGNIPNQNLINPAQICFQSGGNQQVNGSNSENQDSVKIMDSSSIESSQSVDEIISNQIDFNTSTEIPRTSSVDSGFLSPKEFQDDPHFPLSNKFICAVCGKPADLTCQCDKVCYCSAICQSTDWENHKSHH